MHIHHKKNTRLWHLDQNSKKSIYITLDTGNHIYRKNKNAKLLIYNGDIENCYDYGKFIIIFIFVYVLCYVYLKNITYL